MKKIIPSDAVLVAEGAKLAFRGMIFDVYQWPQQLFDGSEYTFEMLKRADTVTAICVVDGKVLVVDDEQPHLGLRRGFPGGRVDAGESAETAIHREIQEETGYSFKNWRLIKVSQPYRKIEWFVYVFLAWEPSVRQEVKLDAGEKITVQPLEFAELKAQVMDDMSGYLGESRDLFKGIETIDELLALAEFRGKEIDR